MERFVFFGKGGIGKSTIAANLSALFGMGGRRVLHVGCDPKHDSARALLPGGMPRTFMDALADSGVPRSRAELVCRGLFGVEVVEAGGPEPGVGCAGRGISLMLETFRDLRLLEEGGYDVVNFDILGDVVCGGFATPLRQGFGEKVFIVVSEELMSLYAANNIAKAVLHHGPNGVVLGGLLANVRDPSVDREPLERFAALLGTRIVGYLPRDPAVREAEYLRKAVVAHAPRSPFTSALEDIARSALALEAGAVAPPTPLDDQAFYDLSMGLFRPPDEAAGKAAGPASRRRARSAAAR